MPIGAEKIGFILNSLQVVLVQTVWMRSLEFVAFVITIFVAAVSIAEPHGDFAGRA
jgi:hypothetical protein